MSPSLKLKILIPVGLLCVILYQQIIYSSLESDYIQYKQQIKLDQQQTEINAHKIKLEHDRLLAKNKKAYNDQINNIKSNSDRLRSARQDDIASLSSAGNDNQLCFSREGFNHALSQLDSELSQIIEESDDNRIRLILSKEFYANTSETEN